MLAATHHLTSQTGRQLIYEESRAGMMEKVHSMYWPRGLFAYVPFMEWREGPSSPLMPQLRKADTEAQLKTSAQFQTRFRALLWHFSSLLQLDPVGL